MKARNLLEVAVDTLQDVRVAFRQMRRASGFSALAIFMLALGIGATTAIFSIVEGVLLRPLPFADPSRLVRFGERLDGMSGTGATARDIATYADSTSAFSSVGGYTTTNYELSGGTEPIQVDAARFSAGVFPTLGVSPMLGRVFIRQDDEGRQPVAVISYALWKGRFHGASAILGQPLVLDRKVYTIIGVMPRSFEFPLSPGVLDQMQVWVPLSLTPDELSEQQAGAFRFQLVGRLRAGVQLGQANQDVDRVAQQIMRGYPPSRAMIHFKGQAMLLKEDTVEDARPLIRTLFFAVLVVLVIACVNVSGLLLVRAIRRRREYAVRLALGAQAKAILQQALIEGLLLSFTGGLLGLALAAVAIRIAPSVLPESMPRIDDIRLDGTVIAFSLVLALATGVLCSLAPAFAAMHTRLSEALKQGGRSDTGAASHTRLRSVLVVTEIAVALTLLTAAGALLRSFEKMRAVDPGFRPDHLLVAGYQLPLKQYPNDATVHAFNQAVVDRLQGKPAVVAVGLTTVLPGMGMWGGSATTAEGAHWDTRKLHFAVFDTPSGDYFHAMGIRLTEGREFTPDDRADGALVVIVNQSLASHAWPGEHVLGKRLHLGNPKKANPWATVVGVVADTKLHSPDEESNDEDYFPAEQWTAVQGVDGSPTLTNPAGGYVTLRSTLPPEEMTHLLRATVAEVDPLLALQQVQSMNAVLASAEEPRRFNTALIGAFAAGALLLAILGVYVVLAFSVSLRSQEMAIRMALGAQRVNIVRLVLVWGSKLALAGCVIGLLGSYAISRLISSLLFDVSATDPIVFAGAALMMVLLSLAVAAIPAGRAASTDPGKALREG